MADDRARWPTTVGTIGIVLGVILLLDTVDELVTLRWTAAEWRALFGPYVASWIDRTMPPVAWRLASAGVQIGLGILLIMGSVGLRRRSRTGVSLCRLWAWLAIGWVIVSMAWGVVWLVRHGGELPPLATSGWVGYMVFGLALALVLLLVFPAFLLVWLSLPEARKEHETWNA